MKALLTGCAGFIGSHLTEKLIDRGYEVIGIDCFTDYYSRELKESNMVGFRGNIDFIEEDILELDMSLLDNVDVLFHLAAQAGVRKSWGEEFDIYTRNNVLATQRLLEGCKEHGIEKFVYASSSSVYGNTGLPMREDQYLKPYSPYGVTKLAGENLCELYRMNFGINCVSLRYFTVYGERQRPDMAFHRFIKSIIEGEPIKVFGDGRQTRDFTYVGDIVDATVKAGESDATGVFNVGGGSRIELIDAIRVLEEVLGEADVRFEESKKGDVRDTYADISKARDVLGYEPKVSLKEGLEREVDWLRVNIF